ncbi:MAG: Poly(A) polymerase I [Chlamydiae bacterium]|nr:Poly(A) polymerase I [Chlamydiota bacterium]
MRPKTFFASEHDIDHSQIDADALHVLRKLTEAGYTAYLVGGSVRDLLTKRSPKDYDISTSARPEEIKALFKRSCILIGRRFRLAHIRYGHKIIEVATFRSGDNDSDLIIRDNTWGTEEEDSIRRDFTINGLFYDPSNHMVIDYVGGWDDIHKGILRTIGDPHIRFKQDPVRMIRLIKFRARFGFEIDEETKQSLLENREEITKSSPARILEEILRMLESGASAKFFHLMAQTGLLRLIFPTLATFLEGPSGQKVYGLLAIADQMNRNSRKYPLSRPILTSCLLFPILEDEIKTKFIEKGKLPHLGEVMLTTSAIIKSIVAQSFTHFPRRISATMVSIITTQYRLTPISGKRHYRHKLLQNKEFPLALKFLKIRAVADNQLLNAYNSWKNIYRQFLKQSGHNPHHHPPPPKKRKRPYVKTR